jgi:hypothetical protein
VKINSNTVEIILDALYKGQEVHELITDDRSGDIIIGRWEALAEDLDEAGVDDEAWSTATVMTVHFLRMLEDTPSWKGAAQAWLLKHAMEDAAFYYPELFRDDQEEEGEHNETE